MASASPGRLATTGSAAHPHGGAVGDHNRAQLNLYRRWRSRTQLAVDDVKVGGIPWRTRLVGAFIGGAVNEVLSPTLELGPALRAVPWIERGCEGEREEETTVVSGADADHDPTHRSLRRSQGWLAAGETTMD